MTTVTTTNVPFLAEAEQFAAARPAPSPFAAEVREAGRRRFADLGVPTPRQEDWKYTSLLPVTRETWTLRDGGAGLISAAEADRLSFGAWAKYRIVFAGGWVEPSLSTFPPAGAGVRVMPLAEALADASGPAARLLQEAEENALGALNEAFLQDGVFIDIAADADVAEPIVLLHVGADRAMAHPRILVSAGRGSRATIVEHFVSTAPGAVTFTNAVTDVRVGENAALTHVRIQREGAGAHQVSQLRVHQERDSRFRGGVYTLGGRLVRNDAMIRLAGEGAECWLDGLYLTAGEQHVDNHTTVVHAVPNCQSHELYKGVLAGKSTGVFNGRVLVPQDAQKTNAEQENHNLLLSRDATINAKPQLEIYADDVKCSHGTTVGQLDETAVFYLRSRGVSEAAARGLLTYAFAVDLIERIEAEPLRAGLEELVRGWLPSTGESQT